ncbi:hypothetical protein [Streptomyces hirsutus]|uniref:hypothetical protein n=1 Tax=Streptomyces hirsutus TaxID=35620 RepID=UPI0036B42D3B
MRSFYTRVRALIIALSAAVAVLAARNVPEGYWDDHVGLFWAAVILGVLAVDPIVNRLGWRREAGKIIKRNEKVRSTLVALLIEVVDLVDADWKSTAVFACRTRFSRVPLIRLLHPMGHVRLSRLDPVLPLPCLRYDHGMPGTAWAAKGESYSKPWPEITLNDVP